MNDHNSKKIVFNKSTLLSLKAELLKKQEEVKDKKRQPQHKVENFKPAPSKNKDRDPNENTVKPSFKERLKEVDTDELEACRKAKSSLEKKAELYSHLSDGAGSSQLAARFLVDFTTKKQQQNLDEPNLEHHGIPEADTNKEDESEWIEFTDCLGRSRKCHKSDLQFYEKRDKELMKAMNRSIEDGSEDQPADEVPKPEKPLLVQKTKDYLQSLRDKWEQKERDLIAKDNDVHYQDLLFDEARMHGVGYYSFSTEESERQKQMDELLKTREETLKVQKETADKRKKREELIAARVAAARARRRLREGLPPEDPKENMENFTNKLLAYLNEQKNEAEKKAKEEEIKSREEQERQRQKIRDAYVREWDIGKDGVEDKKKFKEMTQEEYVEQQRSKRIKEFAPVQERTSARAESIFNDKGELVGQAERTKPKTWSEVRLTLEAPPPPLIGDLTVNKGLYFATPKKGKANMKYRNFVKGDEEFSPTPIVNELSEEIEEERRPDKRKHALNHVEVAPPATFDYYGPVSKHIKTNKPFESNMREAYAQGSKSLETKGSSRQLSSDYDFSLG